MRHARGGPGGGGGVQYQDFDAKPRTIATVFGCVAERSWTVLAAAGVTTVLSVAASIAAFGWNAWNLYFSHVLPFQTEYMATRLETFAFSMPTWFMSGRLFGLPAGGAYALQAVATLLTFALAYRLFRLPVARTWKLMVLGIGTFLATPEAFNDDLSPVSLAILLSPPLTARGT